MTERSLTERVELIRLDDLVALSGLRMKHLVAMPARVAKPDVKGALKILASKPGGKEVIAELQERAKLKQSSSNPGALIGHSEPDTGDPWYAHNAEVHGPGPTSVAFCCLDGPSECPGWWRVGFNMPAQDDLLVLLHVDGNGTLSVQVGGITVGTYSFAGDDWIATVVADVDAGLRFLTVKQVTGYFLWLGAYYYRL